MTATRSEDPRGPARLDEPALVRNLTRVRRDREDPPVGWLALGVAIGAEIIGTSALKESDGFSRVLPALVVLVAYGISFYALSVALRHLPLSLCYAIWSGIGTAAIAVIGIAHYGESAGALRLAGLICIGVGCVIVNLRT
jgi:small multidrug resistance pump